MSRALPEAVPPEVTVDTDGACFATEVTPAVYEEVPGQVQVVQAQVNDAGDVVQPPVYRNAMVPRLVTPRGETRFAAPCAADMTPAFIATVQRALFARGYLRGPITGAMDQPTKDAILRYQSRRGLESAQLSLKTAQELGVSAIPVDPA